MQILRTTPKYFDVTYVINPYMEAGLGQVNKEKAQEEWDKLTKIYEELGVEYGLLEGQPGLPDMVFSANAALTFRGPNGEKCVLISNMAKDERKPESPHYERWFREQGYEIFKLPAHLSCSGTGDILYHADRSFLWGGYGFRTSPETHREVERITGLTVKSLHLVDPWFYDLDTCLAPISNELAMCRLAAFDEDAQKLIRSEFKDLIELTEEEGRNFTCNSHILKDLKTIIMNGHSPRVIKELESRGYKVLITPTNEFLKAGGSVACMKMTLV
jgi:N-dimethylarginine dimethylaminohydrolase